MCHQFLNISSNLNVLIFKVVEKKCKSEIITTYLGDPRTCHISLGLVGLITFWLRLIKIVSYKEPYKL